MVSAYDLINYELDRVYRTPNVNREQWTDSTDDLKQVNTSPTTVKTSRIRVQLSRPLTWAEKEDLETDWSDPHQRRITGENVERLKISVAPNFEHVWAEADLGSRLLFNLVAQALETEYVNVFPRAVRTFREYNGE
jgi:hypothetical protein